MPSRHGRAPGVVAIAAATLLTVGCSNSPVESAGAPAAAIEQAKPSSKQRSACALVDREDMERLAKGKVTLLHNIEAAEQTNCEVYPEGDPKRAVLFLEVYWVGGKELARTEKLAVGAARRVLNDKDTDIEALTGSGSVPGAADDAYYSDVMPSWAVKGDVMIKFTMPGLGADVMQKNFVPLARKALSRL